jgi:hypothetical protein
MLKWQKYLFFVWNMVECLSVSQHRVAAAILAHIYNSSYK